MTFAELRDLVARITYKPGWSFWLQPVDNGIAFLAVSFSEFDAMNQETYRHFRGRHAIIVADIPSARGFLNRLRSYILHIEMHELDEFLRVDGVAPFDPHRGDA
jgi:hypothetical protein